MVMQSMVNSRMIGAVKRALVLLYGVVSYVVFLAVFLWTGVFLANAGVVKGIDSAPPGNPWLAVGVDFSLVALFGISHSVMARPWFKAGWTKVVLPAVERSTYVLVASVVLATIYLEWRTLPATVWRIEQPLLRMSMWALLVSGMGLMVASSFLTDHFDLFGLRQTWSYARGRPQVLPRFRERALYKWVRHPLMLGILLLIWSTPEMSVGHLLFAALMSLYIGIGIHYEERDLSRALGAPYDDYRRRVRAILPLPKR